MRGALVAWVGLVAVALIVGFAIFKLPRGPGAEAGQNIVTIATASFGVVGAIVGAYFGVTASGNARDQVAEVAKADIAATSHNNGTSEEDSQKRWTRPSLRRGEPRHRLDRCRRRGAIADPPLPEDSDEVKRLTLDKRDLERVEILREHGCKYGLIAVEEALHVGLPISYAAAFLEKESSGKDAGGQAGFGLNLFGHDPVQNPVKGGFVTRARYAEYLRFRRAGKGMQGVGPTQLTWYGLQDAADRAGGCWHPRFNMRIGFAQAKLLIAQHGRQDGVAMYNGSGSAAERYAKDWRAKQQRWHDLLA